MVHSDLHLTMNLFISFRLDLYLKDQHCNATLRLNDTVAMSGGQVASISSLNQNTTLYLGNNPDTKDSDTKPFIGCVTDLMVRNKKNSQNLWIA